MPTTNPLEDTPVLVIFAVFAVVSFIAYEIGFRIGHWCQARTPGEQEGPTGILVGSILALLAFLLAVTMGMASDRFDTRRGIVLDEANSIGTTYLRAGYLPEPASSQIRQLLREYVPLRIIVTDAKAADLGPTSLRSNELLTAGLGDLPRAWQQVDATGRPRLAVPRLAQRDDRPARIAGLTAGLYARVPETILLLLFVGSVLTLGIVGYSAGPHRTAQPARAPLVLARSPSARSSRLLVDLDRTTGGVRPGQPAAPHRPPGADRASFVDACSGSLSGTIRWR